MLSEDTGQDLTTVNVAMQKQQLIESEMVKRAAQMDSLQVNSDLKVLFLFCSYNLGLNIYFFLYINNIKSNIFMFSANGTAVRRNASR